MLINLNTSYVKVQLSGINCILPLVGNLNTSYVKVQHKDNEKPIIILLFKYILC